MMITQEVETEETMVVIKGLVATVVAETGVLVGMMIEAGVVTMDITMAVPEITIEVVVEILEGDEKKINNNKEMQKI